MSAISVWEVAVKVTLGKLTIDRDVRSWVTLASSYPGVTVHPLDPRDALESTLLPGRFHRDPADRILIAIARRLGVPLVTSDRAIRRYRHVRTAWSGRGRAIEFTSRSSSARGCTSGGREA